MNYKNIFNKKFINIFLIFVLSIFVLSIFIRDPGIDGYYRATFPDLITGTAHKPYMYRAFLPSIINTLSSLTPAFIKNFFNTNLTVFSPVSYIFTRYEWNKELAYEYILALILLYIFLVGFVFALQKLYKQLFKKESLYLGPLALLALPPFFSYYSYLYDFPTLFFTTLLLILLYQKKWRLFVPIFLLSCLNKETTILITIVFAISFYKKLGTSKYILLVVGQLLIFTTIKIFLFIAFRENPGMFMEIQLTGHNIGQLLQPYSFSTIFVWLILLFLIFNNWNKKPRLLKISLISAIPLVVSSLFVGVIDELRVYYELFPAAFLLLFENIRDLLNNIRKE